MAKLIMKANTKTQHPMPIKGVFVHTTFYFLAVSKHVSGKHENKQNAIVVKMNIMKIT